MSSYRVWFIECDDCGIDFDDGPEHRTLTDLRDTAARQGWEYQGRKDYCPDHRAVPSYPGLVVVQ